jgi:hypothetical protein
LTKKQQHGFLIWKAPGKAPSVKIGHDVIERMTVDIMRGFGVTRRRGTEVGGILLGKISGAEEPLVLIYDYETIPCEYSQGPSYLLSERDLHAFRHAVSQWGKEISPDQYVVGYFRSHTRDGLQLEEADVKVFHQHLKDPLAIALVVKPFATRAAEAAFFLQAGGRLQNKPTLPEFQFTRSESALPNEVSRAPGGEPLTKAEPGEVAEDGFEEDTTVAVAPVSAAPVPPAPAPSPPVARQERPEPVVERELPRQLPERPRPESRALREDRPVRTRPAPVAPAAPMFGAYYPAQPHPWRSRLLWVAYTLAVFGFGAVVGFEYSGSEVSRLQLESRTSGTPVSSPVDPYSVQLSAIEQEQSVLVRWNRDSEAIRTALHGVLTITEGAASKEVKLDFPELRNGSVLYHKVGQQVSFRLDLYFKENRVLTESVTLRFPER